MKQPQEVAGCVIPDAEGRVLLIHRNTPDLQHWELPGGKLDNGELPEVAAVREVGEELGIGVKVVRPLGETSFGEGDKTYTYYWFLGKIISGRPRLLEPEKFDAWSYVAVPDLPEMVLSSNMQNLSKLLLSRQITL